MMGITYEEMEELVMDLRFLIDEWIAMSYSDQVEDPILKARLSQKMDDAMELDRILRPYEESV